MSAATKRLRWQQLSCLLVLAGGLWAAAAGAAPDANDWPWLGRYRADNGAFAARQPGRVVFMGDSITEGWTALAPGKAMPGLRVNRGISGQTTGQMLLRFRQDVIELQPALVTILAGTNDFAENTGPARQEDVQNNIASMAELARAHGIPVMLVSVLPARKYWWRPGIDPADRITTLNRWLQEYARRQGMAYLDLYTLLVDEQRDLRRTYSDDGVHPNAAGYRLMTDAMEAAIPAAQGSAR